MFSRLFGRKDSTSLTSSSTTTTAEDSRRYFTNNNTTHHHHDLTTIDPKQKAHPSSCRILLCQDIGDKRKLTLFDTHYIEIPHTFMRIPPLSTSSPPSTTTAASNISASPQHIYQKNQGKDHVEPSSSTQNTIHYSSNTTKSSLYTSSAGQGKGLNLFSSPSYSSSNNNNPNTDLTKTRLSSTAGISYVSVNPTNTSNNNNNTTSSTATVGMNRISSQPLLKNTINNTSTTKQQRTSSFSGFNTHHHNHHHTSPPIHSSNMIKKSPNIDLLGDMMFGTVPLSSKAHGSSKIHYFRSPQPQVVITKLFTIPQHFTELLDENIAPSSSSSADGVGIGGLSNAVQSSNDIKDFINREGLYSFPKHVHRTIHGPSMTTPTITTGVSGTIGSQQNMSSSSILDPSFFSQPKDITAQPTDASVAGAELSSPQSKKSFDASLDGLYQKFKRQNMMAVSGSGSGFDMIASSSPTPSNSSRTTLNDSLSASFIRRKTQRFALNDILFDSDNDVSESPIMESSGEPASPLQKKSKRKVVFGISLVVDVTDRSELRDFLFTHFALIERRMDLLGIHSIKTVVNHFYDKSLSLEEQPLWNGTAFFCNGFVLQHHEFLSKKVNEFITTLCNFFNAPRLPAPLWLNSQTFTSEAHQCAKQLSEDIQFWSKQSSQHVSLLSDFVTAILTHHLGWTFTIATRMRSSHPTIPYTRDTTLSRKKFDDPKMNWHTPYNTYLAQLTDLYGLIGYHSKAARTIVVGSQKNQDLVKRLLRIASYFIRCGEVFEQIQREEEIYQDTMFVVKQKDPQQQLQMSDGYDQESSYIPTSLNSSQIIQRIPDRFESSSMFPTKAIYNTFGRSLMVNYTKEYCTGAVLMGLDSSAYDETQIKQDLILLSHIFDSSGAIGIVLDVDKLTCKILEHDKYCDQDLDVGGSMGALSSHSTNPLVAAASQTTGFTGSPSLLLYKEVMSRPVQGSDKVSELMSSLVELIGIIPNEMTTVFIEDYMQDLYNSVMMIKMKIQEGVSLFSPEMKMIVGFDQSDLDLLKAILNSMV